MTNEIVLSPCFPSGGTLRITWGDRWPTREDWDALIDVLGAYRGILEPVRLEPEPPPEEDDEPGSGVP